MAIIIRPMAATETDRLQTFLYLSLHVPSGEASFDEDIVHQPKLRKYFAHWGRDGDIAFVAEASEGKLVGAIWSRLHITEYPGYGFIDEDTPEFSVAVLPEFRAQGIGTQLLNYYLNEIKKRGFRKISVSMNTSNPAFHLYQRLGFKRISQVGNDTMVLKLR